MMKTLPIMVVGIFFLMLVGCNMLGNGPEQEKVPGVLSGHLSSCPNSPNCVVSEIAKEDSHYISPLRYSAGKAKKSMDLIKQIIQESGGRITVEKKGYMAAIFTSTFLGFVDNLECRDDRANQTIHLRSASRVGYSDFGVNRKRVEFISNLFLQRMKTTTQELTSTPTKPDSGF